MTSRPVSGLATRMHMPEHGATLRYDNWVNAAP
jgi:hypothetical protein